ncbi:MAG: nuclear transport factor 2 family protein [Pyrinomonadaceae bacterium]|nr:nuclear transport factor 2 family protein [Pyrinomonadaceae bacterium]
MKSLKWVLLLAILVTAFGCADYGTNTANTNTGNSNAATAPANEIKASAAELEKKAYEAWKKKDGKFFEGFLTDGFISVGGSGRNVKAGVAKSISENPCDVKSYAISDEDAVEIGDGVILYTGKNTSDVSCDGKAAPSPLWAATVYVKDGEDWKAAYHQTAPTTDTKGESPAPPADAKPPKLEDADKEITAALSEKEKGLWEAWAKKDTKPFETVLAENFSEINREGRVDRAAALKGIAEHKCEVKSHSLSDFHTQNIAGDIYLITYKGTTDATCDGNPAPKEMWVSTIMKKDGDDWKGLFHMTSPAA